LAGEQLLIKFASSRALNGRDPVPVDAEVSPWWEFIVRGFIVCTFLLVFIRITWRWQAFWARSSGAASGSKTILTARAVLQ
jgi:hypothetical protein